MEAETGANAVTSQEMPSDTGRVKEGFFPGSRGGNVALPTSTLSSDLWSPEL